MCIYRNCFRENIFRALILIIDTKVIMMRRKLLYDKETRKMPLIRSVKTHVLLSSLP